MSAEAQDFAEEETDALDNFPVQADLATQVGNEAIDPARRVIFLIRAIKPDIFKQDGENRIAKLRVRLAIGSDGVDGDGKYAGKNLFPDIITWIDEDAYPKWKNASFDFKEFLTALGFDPASPPSVPELIEFAVGTAIIGNITRVAKKSKVDGVYVATGEFENQVKKFRKAE